jgi:hypothetical protein
MQKIMEKPEVKAKMEETQKEQHQLRDREYALVYKAMDRRQVSNFKKMLGKPFDVDSLMPGPGGFFRGGQGRNGANGGGPQTKGAAKAAPATAGAGTAAPAETKSSPTSKQATTPRRQSLRERRGLGQQPSAGPSGN